VSRTLVSGPVLVSWLAGWRPCGIGAVGAAAASNVAGGQLGHPLAAAQVQRSAAEGSEVQLRGLQPNAGPRGALLPAVQLCMRPAAIACAEQPPRSADSHQALQA